MANPKPNESLCSTRDVYSFSVPSYEGGMRQFSPSSASVSPRDRALATLRYIKKAAEGIEAYIETSEVDSVSTWVLERINQSATALGAALSFISYRTTPKSKKP